MTAQQFRVLLDLCMVSDPWPLAAEDLTAFEALLARECSSGLGLDMDAAVKAKIEKNKTRGFRHGGKRV